MQNINELDAFFGEEIPDELNSAFAEDPQSTQPITDISKFIKSRGYWMHKCHDVGHHIYPQGCVRIEYRGEVIRYADYQQLTEMESVLAKGFTDEVIAQIEGIGCPGPVRVGKPPIDAKGNPVVVTNNGNHGKLKAECEWIEAHDQVFVQYVGTDENWPDGCYAIESAGKSEPDYYDPEQIKYIAHEVLGMPSENNHKRKVRVATLKDTGAALMFEDDPYADIEGYSKQEMLDLDDEEFTSEVMFPQTLADSDPLETELETLFS